MTGPERANRVRREWRVSLALLVVVLILLAGLHVILAGAEWWFALALLSSVLLGVAALVRYISRRRFLAPIASAIVMLVVMTAVFVPGTAFIGLLPTGESWEAFGETFDAAVLSINRQALPAAAVAPIMFLLCLGVGVIVILADLIAVSFRAPALAGIPLVGLLVVPGVVSIDSTDPLVFVFAVLAFLFLLRAGAEHPQRRLSLALSVAVVLGVLVVPLVLPPVTTATGGVGFSTGVNPVLTLGEDLRRSARHTVLEYSTGSGDPQYLRIVSIDNFSGSHWGPSSFELNTRNTPEKIGKPPGLSEKVATDNDTAYIDVRNLTSPWLPLPYPSTKVVGLFGNWYWDSEGLTMKSTDTTSQGELYRATSLTISPTPAQLEVAGTTVPRGFERFLALPDNMPAIISQTAAQVAGGASSNYEKALLLQDYFRDGDFRYSETAPVDDGYDGTGMRVIAQFLQAKSGYCIHFASAMAVMARSLGIPSRVAVGFLPGTQLDRTIDGRVAYEVDSDDLHAWPELYFEGIGWTRFEPTVSRGIVPSYADPSSADVPTPVNTPAPASSAAATPVPTSSRLPNNLDSSNPLGSAMTTGSATAGWLATIAIALAVLFVLMIPGLVRVIERRLRLRDLRRGAATPLTAWREVLQTAEDLDKNVPDTTTPRAMRRLLADGALADHAALIRLVDAVERESYGRGARDYPEVESDARAIIGTLRSITDQPERLRATLTPPSIWAKLFSVFRRTG